MKRFQKERASLRKTCLSQKVALRHSQRKSKVKIRRRGACTPFRIAYNTGHVERRSLVLRLDYYHYLSARISRTHALAKRSIWKKDIDFGYTAKQFIAKGMSSSFLYLLSSSFSPARWRLIDWCTAAAAERDHFSDLTRPI